MASYLPNSRFVNYPSNWWFRKTRVTDLLFLGAIMLKVLDIIY